MNKHRIFSTGIAASLAVLAFTSPAQAASTKPLNENGTGVVVNGGGGGSGGFDTFVGTLHGTLGKATYQEEAVNQCDLGAPVVTCTSFFSFVITTSKGTLNLSGITVDGVTLSYNGPLVVQSGTGRYAGVSGTGTIVAGFDVATQKNTLSLMGSLTLA